MSTLKQRLAEKIKRAAEEKKKEMQQINYMQKSERPLQVQAPQFQDMRAVYGQNFQLPNVVEQKISNQDLKVNNLNGEIKLQQDRENLFRIGSRMNSNTQEDDDVIQVYSFKQQQMMKNPFIVQTQKDPECEEQIENQIKEMVAQKQSRKRQEEEEKKKQMILNALKNKKKPRPPKPMDRPTPFNQLSPPYQQIKIFASYLPIYLQRRRRQHYSRIVDLGVKNLSEVVLQCYLEDLISKSFMKSIKERGVDKQIDFIRKFAANKLDEYDFKATRFTPLDHRALCGLLLAKDNKYILGERIYCVFKQITDFYQVIYGMDEFKYQRLCEAIRIKHKLTWKQSAFKSYEPLDDDAIQKFDTSSIFQLRPSPMFGAEVNDDQKQFWRAKRQKYPQKFKNVGKDAKNQPAAAKVNEDKSSSSVSESYSDSFDQSDIEKELQGADSEVLPSSSFKTSSFPSRRKKASGRPVSDSHSIDSLSDMKNSSDLPSQLINESGQFDMDEDEIIDSQSGSMFKSKSKSMSRRKSHFSTSREKRKEKKMKKSKRKDSSSFMNSESDKKSEDMDDPDIFEDL